mmetsp:Transcript_36747/g.86277  ORF Transcript_36747/g.86277 Transcript_36747/m.86277 type:complete len:118 (-) Transcript_36747:137-490(-)
MLVYLSTSLEESVLSCFDVQQRLFAIPRTSSQSSVLLHRAGGKLLLEHSTVSLLFNAAELRRRSPEGPDSRRLWTRFLQYFSTAATKGKGYLQNARNNLPADLQRLFYDPSMLQRLQ